MTRIPLSGIAVALVQPIDQLADRFPIAGIIRVVQSKGKDSA